MYTFFKIGARLALFFYTKKTVANFAVPHHFNQPKILASNHPNSFFDAIIIAIHYPKPIYFLARGDAFNKPLIAKFLKSLHLIPIYRLSEGKENLSKNDTTFKICLDLLKKNETVLIFSEGVCINEWNLRSLKKGTARLAYKALKEKIDTLVVQPVNLNYSSFSKVPKEVVLNFNTVLNVAELSTLSENEFYNSFNQKLKEGILDKMIVKKNIQDIELFKSKRNTFRLFLFAVPAFFGYVSQYWIYSYFKNLVAKKTKNTVFYDSVLFGLLLFCYPLICVTITLLLGFIFNFKIALITLFLLPFTAWCYTRFKCNL